jgi:hypothetical protein
MDSSRSFEWEPLSFRFIGLTPNEQLPAARSSVIAPVVDLTSIPSKSELDLMCRIHWLIEWNVVNQPGENLAELRNVLSQLRGLDHVKPTSTFSEETEQP